MRDADARTEEDSLIRGNRERDDLRSSGIRIQLMENQAVAIHLDTGVLKIEEWIAVFHCDEFIAVPFAFSEGHIFHPLFDSHEEIPIGDEIVM